VADAKDKNGAHRSDFYYCAVAMRLVYFCSLSISLGGIMENVQTLHHLSLEEEFSSDPRWHLLERIFFTSPLQKSSRSLALLSYLAEHSIRGSLDELDGCHRYLSSAEFVA